MSEPLFPRTTAEQFARKGFARGWSDALDASQNAIPHDEACWSNRPDSDERDCNCWRLLAYSAIYSLKGTTVSRMASWTDAMDFADSCFPETSTTPRNQATADAYANGRIEGLVIARDLIAKTLHDQELAEKHPYRYKNALYEVLLAIKLHLPNDFEVIGDEE